MAASGGKIVARASRLGVLSLFVVIGTVLVAEAAAKKGTSALLRLTSAVTLSKQSPDLNRAAKARINQLSNGTLILVYADAVDANPPRWAYELKGDVQRPVRDIFVRICDNLFADCDDPGNWTAAVNISNTAPWRRS